jgi:hypothetical protein
MGLVLFLTSHNYNKRNITTCNIYFVCSWRLLNLGTFRDLLSSMCSTIWNESHVISRCLVGSWLGVNNLGHGLLFCNNRDDKSSTAEFLSFCDDWHLFKELRSVKLLSFVCSLWFLFICWQWICSAWSLPVTALWRLDRSCAQAMLQVNAMCTALLPCWTTSVGGRKVGKQAAVLTLDMQLQA